MKFFKIFVVLILFASTQLVSAFYSNYSELEFTDLDYLDEYYPAIEYFSEAQVVNGYPDKHFGSHELVNRVEALKMIMLASDIDLVSNMPATTELVYKDVDLEAWYGTFVWQASADGIIQGYPDQTFKPEAEVNLAEALKMIFYANSMDFLPRPAEDPAADVPMDTWYADEVAYAINHDMLWPSVDWNVYPDHKLSRGELLELLYRFALRERPSNIVYTGRASYYADSLQGNSTSSGETFDQTLLTAAHRFFPFGTMLTVVNLDNGATVEVRVNDRGPYSDSHAIDLSSSAFESISPLSRGVIDIFYYISK